MNLIVIIQALEETVYEVALWTLLLPKTLFQVIFKPTWMRGYVTAEWEKEPAERFKDFMSPVLFWILISVVPTALISTRHENANGPLNATTFTPTDTSLIYAVCALLITPVFFAYLLLRAQKQPIQRDSLKRLFHIQCLALAVIQLFEIPMRFTFFALASKQTLAPRFISGSFLLYVFSLIWFVIVEAIIFKQELQVSWSNATGRVIIALVVRQIVIIIAVIGISIALSGYASLAPK